MPGPVNPPAGYYTDISDQLVFTDNLAEHLGFWFWTWPGRTWAAGPYRKKAVAKKDLDRYARMNDESARCWSCGSL